MNLFLDLLYWFVFHDFWSFYFFFILYSIVRRLIISILSETRDQKLHILNHRELTSVCVRGYFSITVPELHLIYGIYLWFFLICLFLYLTHKLFSVTDLLLTRWAFKEYVRGPEFNTVLDVIIHYSNLVISWFINFQNYLINCFIFLIISFNNLIISFRNVPLLISHRILNVTSDVQFVMPYVFTLSNFYFYKIGYLITYYLISLSEIIDYYIQVYTTLFETSSLHQFLPLPINTSTLRESYNIELYDKMSRVFENQLTEIRPVRAKLLLLPYQSTKSAISALEQLYKSSFDYLSSRTYFASNRISQLIFLLTIVGIWLMTLPLMGWQRTILNQKRLKRSNSDLMRRITLWNYVGYEVFPNEEAIKATKFSLEDKYLLKHTNRRMYRRHVSCRPEFQPHYYYNVPRIASKKTDFWFSSGLPFFSLLCFTGYRNAYYFFVSTQLGIFLFVLFFYSCQIIFNTSYESFVFMLCYENFDFFALYPRWVLTNIGAYYNLLRLKPKMETTLFYSVQPFLPKNLSSSSIFDLNSYKLNHELTQFIGCILSAPNPVSLKGFLLGMPIALSFEFSNLSVIIRSISKCIKTIFDFFYFDLIKCFSLFTQITLNSDLTFNHFQLFSNTLKLSLKTLDWNLFVKAIVNFLNPSIEFSRKFSWFILRNDTIIFFNLLAFIFFLLEYFPWVRSFFNYKAYWSRAKRFGTILKPYPFSIRDAYAYKKIYQKEFYYLKRWERSIDYGGLKLMLRKNVFAGNILDSNTGMQIFKPWYRIFNQISIVFNCFMITRHDIAYCVFTIASEAGRAMLLIKNQNRYFIKDSKRCEQAQSISDYSQKIIDSTKVVASNSDALLPYFERAAKLYPFWTKNNQLLYSHNSTDWQPRFVEGLSRTDNIADSFRLLLSHTRFFEQLEANLPDSLFLHQKLLGYFSSRPYYEHVRRSRIFFNITEKYKYMSRLVWEDALEGALSTQWRRESYYDEDSKIRQSRQVSSRMKEISWWLQSELIRSIWFICPTQVDMDYFTDDWEWDIWLFIFGTRRQEERYRKFSHLGSFKPLLITIRDYRSQRYKLSTIRDYRSQGYKLSLYTNDEQTKMNHLQKIRQNYMEPRWECSKSIIPQRKGLKFILNPTDYTLALPLCADKFWDFNEEHKLAYHFFKWPKLLATPGDLRHAFYCDRLMAREQKTFLYPPWRYGQFWLPNQRYLQNFNTGLLQFCVTDLNTNPREKFKPNVKKILFELYKIIDLTISNLESFELKYPFLRIPSIIRALFNPAIKGDEIQIYSNYLHRNYRYMFGQYLKKVRIRMRTRITFIIVFIPRFLTSVTYFISDCLDLFFSLFREFKTCNVYSNCKESILYLWDRSQDISFAQNNYRYLINYGGADDNWVIYYNDWYLIVVILLALIINFIKFAKFFLIIPYLININLIFHADVLYTNHWILILIRLMSYFYFYHLILINGSTIFIITTRFFSNPYMGGVNNNRKDDISYKPIPD